MDVESFIRELNDEATKLRDWGDLEHQFATRQDDLFGATRYIVAETLRRVARALERAEEVT